MKRAPGCICGKHMLEGANEGTCVWCGGGDARPVLELAYARLSVQTASPLDGRVVSLSTFRRQMAGADEAIRAARDWEARHGRLPRSGDWQRAREPGEHHPSYATIRKLFGGWPAFMDAIADVPREQVAA